MHKAVSGFLAEVCSHVKSKELREAIRSELASHLLEKTEELVAGGVSQDDAAVTAIAEMGEPGEIGKRLNSAYRPDYSAVCGGVIMLFIVALAFVSAEMALYPGSRLKYLFLHFIDPPEFVAVAFTAAALLSFGGYRNHTAEELLRRFSKTSIYSGLLWSLMWPLGFLWGGNQFDQGMIGVNIVMLLLSLFYGVLFSAIAHALIPQTATARLRKTPLNETLSIN